MAIAKSIKKKDPKRFDPSYVEIMAPVGSFESLMAAINSGADSVYFGAGHLNMRAKSTINFTIKDLKKISSICKEHKVRTYLTLNTILYDEDLKIMKKFCDEAKKSGIDAVIISDIAAMEYAKKIKLEVHISTQASVSNFEAVKFYSKYANTIVLARELTLEQIEKINEKILQEEIKGPDGEFIKIKLFIGRNLHEY